MACTGLHHRIRGDPEATFNFSAQVEVRSCESEVVRLPAAAGDTIVDHVIGTLEN